MRGCCATLLVLAALAVSPETVAEAQERRTPTHSPEWTDHHGHDPGFSPGVYPHGESAVDGVAEDLQRVVVLCATEPDSPAFDRSWAEYLRNNHEPGMDIEETIEEVLWRSDLYVGFGDGRRGTRPPRATVDHDEMRTRMRAIADQVLPDPR